MASASLVVTSDWSAASNVAAGSLTQYVKSYTITRGRSSELDRVGPGTMTLVLDSPNGLFMPRSTTGSLSGSVLPGRLIKVDWTLSGSTYRRFYGRTVSYTPETDVSGKREVVVQCVDVMDNFQRRETRSTLYTNIPSGSLINNILDNAEFPAASSGSRFIDAGQDTYTFAYFDQRKIDEVLTDILKTEYGFGCIRGDGAYVFHDRFYRQLNSTASATFSENMTDATFVRTIDDVYTEARVTTLPKVIKASTTIWTIQSPVTISPSSTASWFGNYIDPMTCQLAAATTVASPTINTSVAPGILLNSNASGTGTNLSASLTASFTAFAESFKIVASNAGNTTGYITTMTVTGCPIVTYENVARSWLDRTACGLYGLRTLTYDANLITDAEAGQVFAQFLVGRYSSPSNVDRVALSIANGDTTDWQNILRRDLDSKISVTCARLGLNAAGFFVGYLTENYNSLTGLHTVTYVLEGIGVDDQLFIVDVSIVNGTAQLAY